MKAKRILSLLLTVAMIATCSITSFAAFADATDTVQIDVDVVAVTADEMEENGFEVADGEYMYWIIGTISNYGTIEAGSVANKGYKLKSASVLMYVGDNAKVSSTLYLTPGEDNYENWSTTDYGDIGTASIAAQASDDYFAMGFSASEDSSKSYPNVRNTSVSDPVVFAKFPVVAKTNNFVCNVYTKTASFAEFSGKTAKVEGTEKEYTAYPGETATITGNTSVTVGGSAPATKYDITFDVNGTTTVVPTEEGAVPVAPTVNGYEDEGYTYTFAGWDKDVVAATEATTYTAKFTKTAKIFNIKFVVNGEETVVPTAYGEVPAAPAVENYTDGKAKQYTFKNWTPDIVAVTGEATYTAVFEESDIDLDANYVDIVFNVFGKITAVRVEKGTAIPFPTEVVFPEDDYNYTFVGWTNDETSAGTPVEGEVLATEDDTYYAMFKAEIKDAVVSVEAGALNGVAGKDGVVYDNAYKTEATFTRIAGASEIGILFIPAAVAEIDTEWATAVPASVVGDIVGNGSVTVRTAIIKLPARFSGKTLTMLVKPFYMLNNVMVTGEQSSVDIEFTKNLD